ncbi:MAG: hypothetical protein O3A21_07580, partial [Proteobacteria bacterium]|nr:hypothetical protein [Pseudomonadota bacterium]
PPGVDCSKLDWRYTARQQLLREHAPRVIGFLAFLVVAAAFANLARTNCGILDPQVIATLIWLAGLTLAAGILFYVFAVKRRALVRFVRIPIEQIAHDRRRTSLFQLKTETKSVLAAVTLIGFAVFVWAWLAPVSIGQRLGADILLFLAAATTIPFGSWLAHLGIKHRAPYLGLILVVGVVASLWNDNHEIRVLEGIAQPQRSALADDLRAWRTANPANSKIVLVATAGGATRAAYWTTMVLGRLQDQPEIDFATKTFAISSVSGGSLGAAIFRALNEETTLRRCPVTRNASLVDPNERWGVYESCGKAIAQQDFIGPLMAGLLYPDLAQRMTPFRLFPDRAQALEESWETAWRTVVGNDRFAGALQPAASSANWLPRLFLNGTSVSTGKRLITSDVEFDNSMIPDATDLIAMMTAAGPASAYRWSTSANNSARFPGMEPAGTLRANRATVDYLVDGGYYENFGAATAEDLLATICRGTPDCGTLVPVVIQISADPDYSGAAASLDHAQGRPPKRVLGSFVSELLAPAAAFFNARTARGHYAAAALKRRTQALGGAFFEFRLCSQKFSKSTPLGWWLSSRAFDEIDAEFDPPAGENAANNPCRKANRAQLVDLIALLKSI